MKETISLFLGFLLLALGGKSLYRFYRKICGSLAKAGGVSQDPGPAALTLTGFSLTTLFILLIMAYTAFIVEQPVSVGSILLGGVLILFFDNLLIFGGYQYNLYRNSENLSHQLIRQKRRAEAGYYSALEEQYGRQRVLIHDIRKHLEAIRDLADHGAAEEIAQYLRELEASPALQNKVRICGNRTLDVVLCRYREVCEKKGIGFSADVRDQSVDFLRPSDMTALFGNLLENAVEAAEGGERPYLELLVDTRPGGAAVISLVNSCAVPPQGDSHRGFQSRKADREQHGLGLKSVADTVRRYGGVLRQYYDPETKLFHTVVMLK